MQKNKFSVADLNNDNPVRTNTRLNFKKISTRIEI